MPTTTEKLYRCGRCESVTSAEHHYKSPLGISCRRATWCHVAEAPSESVCSVCSLLSNFVCGLVVRGGRTFSPLGISPWTFPPPILDTVYEWSECKCCCTVREGRCPWCPKTGGKKCPRGSVRGGCPVTRRPRYSFFFVSAE